MNGKVGHAIQLLLLPISLEICIHSMTKSGLANDF